MASMRKPRTSKKASSRATQPKRTTQQIAATQPKRTPQPKRTTQQIAATQPSGATGGTPERVQFALEWLEQHATEADRDNLERFGIVAKNALGVSMANVQRLAKLLGKDHALAAALWDTDCYEARLLTAFVAEPAALTSRQMDAWCRDFDNWAVCDTVCFHLFDRSKHAWSRVRAWRALEPEFSKRAAFALMASIAGHDETASDEQFVEGLVFIEAAASDPRNFVKKGIDWALRRLGSRNSNLNQRALAVAARLAASPDTAARWIGRSSLRELGSDKARARFAAPAKGKVKTQRVARSAK
jgi:3-methyladenine DNA glycosylase AlkD